MQKPFFFLLLFFSSFISPAQTSLQVDSLLKAVDSQPQDSARMKMFNRIGNYYMDNNAGKAIEYFTKALEIAKKLDRTLPIANNYYNIGFCYLLKGDFSKSLDNYLQSVRLYEQLKDSFRLSNGLLSVGNVYMQTKDAKKTFEYYDKAHQLVAAMKDSGQLSAVLNSKGTLHDQLGNFDSALLYMQRSYEINKLSNDSGAMTYALSNIGLTYKHQGNEEKALACFDTVLTIYRNQQVPLDNFAVVYNNIGATYAQAGNYAKAKEAFYKSIEYSVQSGGISIEMENYRNMSDMYGSMKNYELQSTYLKRYYNIKDSLFNADTRNQLTQLESDYQLGKKNLEIVKKDTEVAKQKNQRNIFIVIALAMILLFAVIVIFYKRSRENNILLKEKNLQISEQKDELQTLNQVKDRLFSIISHDLRNPLVTLRSYLSLSENDQLATEKKLQFRQQTMNAISHTSDMLDNLLAWANTQIKNNKATIIPVSISDCVWDVVHNVQAQATQKQVNIHQDVQATTALGDYDILSIALRNLLTNAIKYSAEKKTVAVTSTKKEEHIFISVKDEGIGLSKDQISDILSNQNKTTKGTADEKGSGLGLFLVKELLQKINAELLIESEPGKGSIFSIKLDAL